MAAAVVASGNEAPPVYLFKILSLDDFPDRVVPSSAAALKDSPTLPTTALDKSEGFIHMSRARQLALPLSRFFSDVEEIVLLRVVWEEVKDDVRWDRISSGDEYPHLLRELRGEDCDEVKVVKREGRTWEETIAAEKEWVLS